MSQVTAPLLPVNLRPRPRRVEAEEHKQELYFHDNYLLTSNLFHLRRVGTRLLKMLPLDYLPTKRRSQLSHAKNVRERNARYVIMLDLICYCHAMISPEEEDVECDESSLTSHTTLMSLLAVRALLDSTRSPRIKHVQPADHRLPL